jgi:hypothetical protein
MTQTAELSAGRVRTPSHDPRGAWMNDESDVAVLITGSLRAAMTMAMTRSIPGPRARRECDFGDAGGSPPGLYPPMRFL